MQRDASQSDRYIQTSRGVVFPCLGQNIIVKNYLLPRNLWQETFS